MWACHVRRQQRNWGGFLVYWSEREDLNLRPLVSQTSALTGLRHAPTVQRRSLIRKNSRRAQGSKSANVNMRDIKSRLRSRESGIPGRVREAAFLGPKRNAPAQSRN